MGRLIVVEGLDGSGKQTLTRRLAHDLTAAGRAVGTLTFPRYGRSVPADLVRDMLYGRLGDLSDSVYGGALLFALDRQQARGELVELLDRNDVVLLDRYVSSNAAYGAARLGGPDIDAGFPAWVAELEMGRFGLPVPHRQVLLATSVQEAAARARGRAAVDQTRALDRFEADGRLQQRTAAMYAQLAGSSYLSPWTVLHPAPMDGDCASAGDLLDRLGLR